MRAHQYQEHMEREGPEMRAQMARGRQEMREQNGQEPGRERVSAADAEE